MAWNDTPPSKEDLSWMDAPPDVEPQDFGPEHLQAGVEAFGRGASLGTLPRLQSLMDTIVGPESAIDEELRAQGFSVEYPDAGYDANLRRNIERQALQNEQFPKTTMLTELAGNVAVSPALASGLGAVARGVPGAGALVQAFPGASRALSVPLSAGAESFLIDDPTKPLISGEQLMTRLENAGLGTLLGGAGQLVGKGAKAASGAAKRAAFKALGPYTREVMQNARRGNIESIGQDLLDEGAVGKIPVGYGKLSKRIAALKDQYGKKIGALIDEFDPLTESRISKKEVGDAARERLLVPGEYDQLLKKNEFFNDQVDRFLQGDGDISLKKAQELKQILKKEINDDRLPGADIPKEEQGLRALRTSLSKAIEDAEERGATKLGKLSELKPLKKKYGNFKEALRIVDSKQNKELAKNFASPSDKAAGFLAGALGAAQGDANTSPEDRLTNALLYGVPVGLGNKYLRRASPQITANVLDAMSQYGSLVPSAMPALSREAALLRLRAMMEQDGE